MVIGRRTDVANSAYCITPATCNWNWFQGANSSEEDRSAEWNGIALSNSTIFATLSNVEYDYEYAISTNGGKTWVFGEPETSGSFEPDGGTQPAISSNGKIILMGDFQNLFLSIDGAGSWTYLNDATFSTDFPSGVPDWFGGSYASFYSVAMSLSGARQIAGASVASANDGVYSSSNTGSSWVAYAGEDFYNDIFIVSISGDGTQYYAAIYSEPSRFLTSNDGVTWTVLCATPDGNPVSSVPLAVSEDGQILLYVSNYEEFGSVWISENGGGAWREVAVLGQHNWSGAAMSSDGQIMIVSVDRGYLHVSCNGGNTWQIQSAPGQQSWAAAETNVGSAVGVSPDGATLAAIEYSEGYIWVGTRVS